MATLYLNTSAEQTVLLSQYRLFNWQKAVVIEREPDHPLFARETHNIWIHILGFLDPETLSMRQVCTYFTHPVFNDVYKNGTVIINTMHDQVMCLSFIKSEIANITNPRLMLGPNLASDKKAFFNLQECRQIATRMKNLKALPPVQFCENDGAEIGAGKLSFAPLVTELSYSGDSPNWSYFLNQHSFPLLKKLEFYGMHFIGGTSVETSHPLLQSLSLSWGATGFMGVALGMNRRNLSQILGTCPQIEKLVLDGQIHRDFNDPETDPVLELALNKRLKDLKIDCAFLTGGDLGRLLDAYPNIQSLTLIGHETLVNVFSTRMDGEWQYLEKVRLHNCELTIEDYLSLLCAAPNLKDLNISSGSISGQLDIDKISNFHFPAMRKFSLQSPQDNLLPLVERMPNLCDLSLIGCQVVIDQIATPEAYVNLKKLWVTGKSHLRGNYLNGILMRAKELEDITWEASTCPWMFGKLEKGVLSALKSVYIQNVSSSYVEMMSLFEKAVMLEKLVLPAFSFVPDDLSKLALPAHSLPSVKRFEETKLSLPDALIIIEAASQLERLDIPLEHLSVLSELPDGYLSKLRVISCLESVKLDDCKAILPNLQRVAPNLQLPARMIEEKET